MKKTSLESDLVAGEAWHSRVYTAAESIGRLSRCYRECIAFHRTTTAGECSYCQPVMYEHHLL